MGVIDGVKGQGKTYDTIFMKEENIVKKVLLVSFAVLVIVALMFAGCAGGGAPAAPAAPAEPAAPSGPKTINYDEAKDYIGQEVTICGPIAIAEEDAMAPITPTPKIVVLGKLGGAGDFGSTNFMPGNFSMMINNIEDQIPGGDWQAYFAQGKEICITATPEVTPVNTIGCAPEDIKQIVIK